MMIVMQALILLLLAGSASVPALPPGKGKPIVQRACGGCHALKVVTSKRATEEQWSATVDQMVSRGADLSDEEIETVIAYLSKNFGPSSKPASPEAHNSTRKLNVNRATAAQLTAGLGLSKKDADAVVQYRQQNGDFKTIDDLTKVPGIDLARIESGKDKLQF
jgi:competence protein ComEA